LAVDPKKVMIQSNRMAIPIASPTGWKKAAEGNRAVNNPQAR
jgi:hypothetical protein